MEDDSLQVIVNKEKVKELHTTASQIQVPVASKETQTEEFGPIEISKVTLPLQ